MNADTLSDGSEHLALASKPDGAWRRDDGGGDAGGRVLPLDRPHGAADRLREEESEERHRDRAQPLHVSVIDLRLRSTDTPASSITTAARLARSNRRRTRRSLARSWEPRADVPAG